MIRNFQERQNKLTQPKQNDFRFLRLKLLIIYRLLILCPMVCEQMILFRLENKKRSQIKSSPQGTIFACGGFRA